MTKEAVKYGLILGVIGILYSMIGYLSGIEVMASFAYEIILFVITLGVSIFLAFRYRRLAGGYISFKNAFIGLFIMFAISGIISTFFNILLFNVIDTDLPNKLNEAIIVKTTSMLEGMGIDQEKIDETIEQIEKESSYTIAKQISSYFWSLLLYALGALILAAIIKKDPPLIEETHEASL